MEKLVTWWKLVLLIWLTRSFKMTNNPKMRAEALLEGSFHLSQDMFGIQLLLL